MAETQKTLAALLALFADNTTGDISPQDLRDFLVSSQGGYGAIYLKDGVTAQAGITATPAKLTGFAVDGVSSGTTPDHTTDKITVLVAGDYHVAAGYSFAGSANNTFEIEIYNNTTGTGYALERKLGTGGDTGSATVNGIITCAANDDISLYISSPDGGTTVTPSNAQLIVKRVG